MVGKFKNLSIPDFFKMFDLVFKLSDNLADIWVVCKNCDETYDHALLLPYRENDRSCGLTWNSFSLSNVVFRLCEKRSVFYFLREHGRQCYQIELVWSDKTEET